MGVIKLQRSWFAGWCVDMGVSFLTLRDRRVICEDSRMVMSDSKIP